jgi:hypothetical protein
VEAPADIAKTGTMTLRFIAAKSQRFQYLRIFGKDTLAAKTFQ